MKFTVTAGNLLLASQILCLFSTKSFALTSKNYLDFSKAPASVCRLTFVGLDNNGTYCTGSLISKHLLLTAAHCALNLLTSPKLEILCNNGKDQLRGNGYTISPSYLESNPSHNPNNPSARHDVALISVYDSSILPESPTKFARLASQTEFSEAMLFSRDCQLWGYGLGGSDGSEPAGVLRGSSTRSSLLDSEESRSRHLSYNGVMLASSGTMIATPPVLPLAGDSGAPLFCPLKDGSTVLAATVSWGIYYQNSSYAGYEVLPYNIFWINSVVRKIDP